MGLILQGNQNTTKLLNQLKAASQQYKSLSKEEERKLIRKYKHDRQTLNHLLFMHNIRLVFSLAKRYMSKTKDVDGLVQDGMNGLAEAIKRFDTSKDVKFITFAYFWIRKYILLNFDQRKTYIDLHRVSMNAPIKQRAATTGDKDNQTVENFLSEYMEPTINQPPTIHNQISAAEQQIIYKDLLETVEKDNSLSATDKAIFIDMFCNNEKIRDIADRYKTTSAVVAKVKNQVLQKLRNIIEQKYDVHSFYELG